MTVADVTSSIKAIEQRIASISPSAAQVFGIPSTTSAATPASFATQLQTAGVDQTGTAATTLPDLVPGTTTAPATTTAGSTATASTDTQYDSLIQQAARDQGVDPALLKGLVQAESGFNPSSVSSVGAQGLTQLMPDTAKGLGVTNPFDPLQNLEGGARFLAGALKRFGGNEQLALAAYNAGPGAVERYGGIPPYAETQAYVQKVLANADAYRRVTGATTAMTAAAPEPTAMAGFAATALPTPSFA
jgi:soluble lytic murein transglycosylase-like protein